MSDPVGRATGMLLGLAVGDALGTTLEFGPRRPTDDYHTEITGGGPFKLHPGQWTDDTAMALGLGQSLIARNAFDALDILSEWAAWMTTGRHSCTGACFDIGNATSAALHAFLLDPAKLPLIRSSSLGNGPLMRLAPVVLFAKSSAEAESLAIRQAKLTHATEAAVATGAFGKQLFEVMTNGAKACQIPPEIQSRSRLDVTSSGFYQDTLEASLWAVATTTSFEEALIEAVNLGGDADTVGAVTGQLAGALYGASNIPSRWLKHLAWKDRLETMALKLLNPDQST